MYSKNRLLIFLLIILGALTLLIIQFQIPTLYGTDGYLHIRMAQFTRELGFRYDFHWARYSIFNTHFADKDFLYHVLLVPFTYFRDIFFGAKVAAFLFASALLIVFWFIAGKYTHRKVVPFLLVAFFLSPIFLKGISYTRPITLSIILNILAIHFIINKKYFALFIISVLYNLSHVTGPAIIFFAFLIETIRYLDRRDFYLRSIYASLLGTVVGFLIHPNFPNNIRIFFYNSILVPIYSASGKVLQLGAELYGISGKTLLFNYTMVIFIFSFLMIAAIMNFKVKTRFETKAFFAISIFFTLFSFTCQRSLMHGYLIILIMGGCYVTDYIKSANKFNRAWLIPLLIFYIILAGNTYNVTKQIGRQTYAINLHCEGVGRYMKQVIPKGEIIFHAPWSESAYFIALNPKNDYFVVLDPIFMYKWNRDFYGLYNSVCRGLNPDPYNVFVKYFKIRYGYISKIYNGRLYMQVRNDPRFQLLYEDAYGILFKITAKPLQQ